MKAQELRNLTVDELKDKAKQLEHEMFNLRTQARTGRIEKPGRFKSIRQDVARILTVLKEKQ